MKLKENHSALPSERSELDEDEVKPFIIKIKRTFLMRKSQKVLTFRNQLKECENRCDFGSLLVRFPQRMLLPMLLFVQEGLKK